MEFNPNKPPPQYVWATYVPGRRPEFKTYHRKNHATCAITTHGKGILYRWEGDKWVELSRKESN